MSDTTNNNNNNNASDDEFHDAISGEALQTDASSSGTKSKQMTDKEIDELVEKHSEIKISDESPEDAGEGATGGAASKEIGGDGDNTNKSIVNDCEVSVEDLTELQKGLSEEELALNKEKADKMKLEANEFFKNDDSERAIEIYTAALNICPLSNTKERAVLYGNRAAAKMKIDANKSAVDDCTKAIELWPEYVRVLLRRAKLYEQEDKLDEALEDFKKVYELDPGQPDARQAQVRLPPLINQRNEKLKAEMMTNLKDLGNMILKPFGLSTSNFQMQQDPNSGSYSINFNQGGPK